MVHRQGQGKVFISTGGTPSLEFPFLNLKRMLVSILLGFYTDVHKQEEREALDKVYGFLHFSYKPGRKISLTSESLRSGLQNG